MCAQTQTVAVGEKGGITWRCTHPDGGSSGVLGEGLRAKALLDLRADTMGALQPSAEMCYKHHPSRSELGNNAAALTAPSSLNSNCFSAIFSVRPDVPNLAFGWLGLVDSTW